MTIGIGRDDDNSCNDINLSKLAVIAAFLTLTGDFLAFILTLLELQEQNLQSQADDKKNAIKLRIIELEDELCKMKRELDD